MSKVAIQGAATGTGVFTLASPATNTDRTLVLPDEAGTIDTLQRTGNVLQVKSSYKAANSGPITWSGNSSLSALYDTGFGGRTYTSAGTVTITPSSTDSKLVCFGQVGWSTMPATDTMAHGQVITLNDTSAIDTEDYPWYQHSNFTSSTPYYPGGSIQGIFEPNSTSAQTIRLRPYVYFESTNTGSGRFAGYSLIVMEIAG